jgi:hypothetical protein
MDLLVQYALIGQQLTIQKNVQFFFSQPIFCVILFCYGIWENKDWRYEEYSFLVVIP